MKISSSFSNINQYDKSFKAIPSSTVFFPNAVGTIGKIVGEYVSMPEHKLLLSSSALLLQPRMDLKFADEDKKIDSSIKTASKIIAGGTTGVSIRGIAIAITKHFIGFNKSNKLNMHFFPDAAKKMKEDTPNLADIRMDQYCKTLGTLFAVLFMMLYSNKHIDVPLTNDLQDLLGGVIKENKTWLKSLNDVMNGRKEKIKDWFKKKQSFVETIQDKSGKIINIIKNDSTSNNQKVKKESNK